MSDTQIFKETWSVTYPLPGQEVTQGPTHTRQVQGIGYQPSVGGGYSGGREPAYRSSLEVGIPVERMLEIRRGVDAYARERDALDAASPAGVERARLDAERDASFTAMIEAVAARQEELRVEPPVPHVATSGVGPVMLFVVLVAVGIMLLFRGR